MGYRRRLNFLLLAVVLFLPGKFCQAQPKIEFGPLTDLRTAEGRMSFGTIVSADVVSWSAPNAKDLLIARLWDGVYLYPSQDLVTIGEPIRLCDQLGHVVLMIEPIDWDGDGIEEAIGTDREGNISALRRVGKFPDLKLEVAQRPLMSDEGLPFNIPFVNPKYRLLDRPELVWPESFNYTYPTIYRPRGNKSADLIIGDWGGELWFLPQTVVDRESPIFGGRTYARRNGKQFARPRHLLSDAQGRTLLIGYGTENGIRYPGGASRPVMYRNENTKSDDLIVLCSMEGNEFRYLQRVQSGPEGEPVFNDLGEMIIEGLPDEGYDAYNYHGVLAIVGDEPWPDLLLSRGCDLAVCKNERVQGTKPKFRFHRWISGKNVPTRGYNFTEILTDQRRRRFLLENDSQWSFRELTVIDGQPRLSSERFPLVDQNGVFRVEGDTDAQHLTKWGFHRAALWDHDGSGRQHLIVGTDKGWLYLLRQEKPLNENPRFEFQSMGPLKDANGRVIRVHHRVVAAPLDLDADGDLDLVLAGATYAPNDPNPGSGIYYVLNEGLAPDLTPILSPVQPLETIGHVHPPFKHHHAQLQSLDLFGTGERLLVAGTQMGDHFRGYVYRPARGKLAVEHTGVITPPISIEERLLDLDGDGDWEYIRSGGESLIAKYAHVQFEKVAATPPVEFPGIPADIAPYDWPLEQLRVPAAHRQHRGNQDFVVAVIDLGYRHHPKLEGHLWVNPSPSLQDADGREDRHGWDFADNDGSLEYDGPQADSDYYMNHHVFVAGEVAAVAPECSIMILRVSYANHESWHQAVSYATAHGAKVLVMPHGYISRAPGSDVPLFYQGTDFTYPEDNPKLREAIDDAYDSGCLIFSGTADNRGRRVAFFPVASESVCAVGSSNRRGEASNMAADADYVEFAAPAGQRGANDPKETIWGLSGRGGYTSFEGGCMACSFAGGVAALVWSRHPEWNNEQVRQVLRNTAERSPTWTTPDRKLGFGVLNAEAALNVPEQQLVKKVELLPDSVTVVAQENGFQIQLRLQNAGVWDVRRAMVVAYNGDPTLAKSPAGTLAKPGPELQTRQLGHTVVPVRGLQHTSAVMECSGAVPEKLWFEVFCLDRRANAIHRSGVDVKR